MMHFREGPYLVSEVAEQMGVSAETVRRAIRNGELKARPKRGTTKPMYVMKEDVEKWKEAMFA